MTESSIERVKLLISARDPSTATSFRFLLKALALTPNFEVKVLCQAPASNILADVKGIQFVMFEALSCHQLLDEMAFQKEVVDFQADAFLMGVSGPETGIDEACLMMAKRLNKSSYALQSFWGQFNTQVNALPDVAFVLDAEAARLTQQKAPAVNAIPIGSLQHMDYVGFDVAEARTARRKKWLEKTNYTDTVIVGLYGQPMFEVLGYQATLSVFIEQLAVWDKRVICVYRPHPKESSQQTLWLKNLALTQLGIHFLLDDCEDIRESLAGCDLVVSAFSTCGLDNLYLNELAEKPFSSSIYLLFNDDLMAWWLDLTGLNNLPLVTEELILAVDKEDRVLQTLENGLNIRTRERLADNAKVRLPDPKGALTKVVEVIQREKSKHGVPNR